MQRDLAVYRHNDSLVARDLAGEKVIIPVRSRVGDLGSIYTLNSTANEIWKLVDGIRTTGEIIAAMAHDYDVEHNQLATDVYRTLDELQQQQLIVNAGEAGDRG